MHRVPDEVARDSIERRILVYLGHTRHETTLQFCLRAALWLDAWEFIVRRHAATPLRDVLDSDLYCRPRAVVCIR